MKEKITNLKRGLKRPFGSPKAATSTILISFISFVAIALSGSLEYSTQMFSAGTSYWLPAIQRRVLGLYFEGGVLSLITTTLYSVLIGVTISNFVTQVKASGAKLRSLSGIGPGFLAAGCAGCGVGLLSFLGVAGGVALLPFNGQLVRLGGLSMLVYYIVETGDPKTCSIPS